jgi:7-keto-8-aminopelargonate synthetase-like enzyme
MGIKDTLHSQETTMFMLKSRHREIVDTIRNGSAIVHANQHNEIVRLRAQLEEHQVRAVRDTTTGRFTKRTVS